MFGFQREPGLQQSWLTGAIMTAALLRPVLDARMVCAWTEPEARALRDSLQSVFEQWRKENGTLPDASNSGLLGNLYEGKPLAECPPYKCAGASVWDYPGLLAKLRAEQYPPLMELEAEADNICNPPHTLPDHIPRLPTAATKPGMQRILAALILSEAAAGSIDSAAKAHWDLSRIRDENQRRVEEGMRAGNQMMYTLAMKGVKFIPGGSRRSAKAAFQKAAEPLFKANEYNIAKTIQEPALAEFRRKHYGAHTLRDWLREIRPEGTEVKGRPKKT
jgi:hypothetical protein